MVKRAQGLPMQTIALIIIVIIVIAAVVIFFYGTFGKSGEGMGEQQIFADCNSKCQRAQAIAMGDTLPNAKSRSGFCTPVNCANYMTCNTTKGVVTCP